MTTVPFRVHAVVAAKLGPEPAGPCWFGGGKARRCGAAANPGRLPIRGPRATLRRPQTQAGSTAQGLPRVLQ